MYKFLITTDMFRQTSLAYQESWFNNYVEIVQMMHNASSNSTPMPDFMEECTAMRSWGCHMINSTEEQKATWLCLVYFSLRLVIFSAIHHFGNRFSGKIL